MSRHARRPASLTLGATLAVLAAGGPALALEIGQKAPGFSLAAPGGRTVTLADLLGKGPIVVYTFIQAFTSA
jgi:hypothetical protein